MFPTEIGGSFSTSELLDITIEDAIPYREELLTLSNLLDIEVSETKVNFGNSYDADLDAAIVGSFRKLTVD